MTRPTWQAERKQQQKQSLEKEPESGRSIKDHAHDAQVRAQPVKKESLGFTVSQQSRNPKWVRPHETFVVK